MSHDDLAAERPPTPIIAIVGAESTGKTTLTQALAEQLRVDTGLSVAFVPEHLRAWCEAQGRTPRRDEQTSIAKAQEQAINTAAATHDLVVADTTSLMTAIYSRLIFNDHSLIAPAIAYQRRMAISLVTRCDIPWVADGLQRDGPQVQAPVTAQLRQLLIEHALPWAVIGGQGAQRLEAALDAVAPIVRALPSTHSGLFTRLAQRNAQDSARTWRCERCDDPACEHALRQGSTAPPKQRF
jgi:nicotinamide riboside kinase